MSNNANTYEAVVVDGLELYHTFRGHWKDIEVYAYQSGPKTYSLYKKTSDDEWQADWAASYQIKQIPLSANPKDLDAMLKDFVAAIHKLESH